MPYSDPKRQSKYQCDRVARRRTEWLTANGPCVDCGSWERLEVDHVDPALKVSHRIWFWSERRLREELSKCVPRCFGCHLKKSALEHAKGENAGCHVLTAQDVASIRRSSESNGRLADRYGVDRATIFKARKGITWKHLPV